ncbi:GntR family transcriptional regulator [Novosphingobium naphthalenivorans]|uniref:GntR family transcriptional regulator n=1 Tax=Novosphingobium naphthalenivorans TaxID=273168 RepID=UPI000835DE89|nr:GntR family transcriptional regulator [Novosphingobium naphthalenivorans]
MNAGTTAGRVYDALKALLLSGAVPPGEHLEPARLAEGLASSVTPVRDALHRLVGERLVEARTSSGFNLPLVTEAGLRDRYRWNEEVLFAAIRARRPTTDPEAAHIEPSSNPSEPDRSLFERIGALSGNFEHGIQIAAASDRLSAARAAEYRVFDSSNAEIARMHEALGSGTLSDLRRLVRGYHRRRLRAVPEVVRLLYHPPQRPGQ